MSTRLSTPRRLIAAAGVLLALFGAFRLLTEVPRPDLLTLAVWLIGALVLHDGLLAPLTAAAGAAVTKLVPRRLRRYLQGGFVVGAFVTLIALPLIHRRGTQAPEKALLEQDYAANLAVLLGGIAGATAVLYVVGVVRDRRASAAKVRPAASHTSSSS